MKELNMKRADFVMSLLLLCFGIAVTALSLRMPRFETLNINPYSVPGIVPGFLGVVLALLGAVMLVRSVRAGGFRLGIDGKAIGAFFSMVETRRITLTVALGTAYAMGLLGRVHFTIATGIFVFAFILVFELKRGETFRAQWKTLFFGAVLACATSAAVYAVFAYLFLVNLP